MSEIILNEQNTAQITKNYITQLLEQLTTLYQQTKEERKELAARLLAADEEFTLIEELDLLTTDIRGYASQIQVRGEIHNQQEAIQQLQNRRVFHIPTIAQFYFTNQGQYETIKTYIRLLDYLRLLILEYLYFYQIVSEPNTD